jgi:16S rRNA (adenine1518-N6/adenine1519-N6)-dimethyltransferase
MPMIIPASAFYPEPNVDSAVVRIELYDEPLIPVEKTEEFFALAKAGFGQKRKTLRNSLSSNLHLSGAETEVLLNEAGIDPMRRAETLSIEEWKKLMAVFIK